MVMSRPCLTLDYITQGHSPSGGRERAEKFTDGITLAIAAPCGAPKHKRPRRAKPEHNRRNQSMNREQVR